jgi:hypothetical protein
MKYTVKAYRTYTMYDKCWIDVEASSPEEALALVKADPDAYDFEDSKTIDIKDGSWEDQNEWEVV